MGGSSALVLANGLAEGSGLDIGHSLEYVNQNSIESIKSDLHEYVC